MKLSAPPQLRLCAVLCLSCLALACGSSSFNDPPGIASTSVAATTNPLVAQYTVTSAMGCTGQIMVEFGPNTSYGRNTSWYPVPGYRQQTTILVAGMKASTTYHMRVQAECLDGSFQINSADTTFTTGPLPALAFPTLAVSRPSPSTSSPENSGIELVDVINSVGTSTPAIFADRDGNPIWYFDIGQGGNFVEGFKLMPNGHVALVIDNATAPAVIMEVDLAGNVIRQMDVNGLGTKMEAAGFDFVPAIFHHDLLPLPNGHLIVLVNSSQNFTNLPGYPGTTAVVGDGLVDLDQNWNPVWAWNSFDHQDSVFNVNRHLNGLPDWTHSNAIVYSAEDGNLLLSMRHQSWIFKIDYENGSGSGAVLWKLGNEGDFALTDAGIPTEDPSEWFSFQHFPSLVSQSGSQMNLAVWDNGDFRPSENNSTCGSAPQFLPCYSRATIFNIDESSMVTNLSWSNLPGYYSPWGGAINQLENGNVEFDINAIFPAPPNTASEVQEVTPGSTPQIVWKLDIQPATNTAYRAYRVPSLYPGVTWSF